MANNWSDMEIEPTAHRFEAVAEPLVGHGVVNPVGFPA